MSLRFYGASDDLFEIDGDVSEEIGCYDKVVTVQVGDEKGGIRVIGEYAPKGGQFAVWRFSLEPIDEGVRIPWPVNVGLSERGYSVEVRIDCPKGTPVYHEGARLDC